MPSSILGNIPGTLTKEVASRSSTSQFTILVCSTCSPARLIQEVKDDIKGFIITGQDRVAQALWVFLGGA